MEQLARLRELKGFSQRALAKESGVSPATIYELENGRRRPNPSTLRKLAGALGVEVADLLGADYPKERAPESPKGWLRAHDARLLSLSEEELDNVFRALFAAESVKFADRINREWQAVAMARDLAEDPNAPLVREAYVHASSRYLQARQLAPVSTSYDPDDPEKAEQVPIVFEKPERSAHHKREGRETE
jgi:transcriptional regulator with XRE-family HTH domain